MKILSILGTRPEAIKMAPVIRLLNADPRFQSIVCVTAQHRQMLDQALELFQIKPDFDLNLMRPNQSLPALTAAALEALDPLLTQTRPDWILAQGDTTTVMAAALMAYYHKIRFGHVEAGLRTGDKFAPFPEEINRRLAGVMADLHFAPTDWARQNLLREGVPAEKILVTGNTVIDALRWAAEQPFDPDSLLPLGLNLPAIEAAGRQIVLVTAHRRENFGAPLEAIFRAILSLAQHRLGQTEFIYPVHLNPQVQEPAYRILSGQPNIHLIAPLDYLPLINVLKRASLALTDSGGLQEEAPGLGVPVLVLREVTERPEGIAAGTVRLVGADPQKIEETSLLLLTSPAEHAKMARAANPYGDGHAAERILAALSAWRAAA
ncbi:MAG: UDP-N-acetylglucosamine 2-epimerase (non-hydrolyzing) [Anaerolineales bacterium]